MTASPQTLQQSSPNENPTDRDRSRHMVRWIVIAIGAIALLGTGTWMLWRTPDLTSVPTIDAPVETVESALRVDVDNENAQATGSRPVFARAGTGAAVRADEDPGTAANGLLAKDVDDTEMDTATERESLSQASQTSHQIVTIVGINGAEVWQNGQLLQTVPVGTRLTATARSADGLWLLVQMDEAEGWTEVAQLYAFGLDSLPVLDSMPETVLDPVPDTAVPDASVLFEEIGLEVAEATEMVTAADVPETEEEITVSAVVTLASSRLNVRRGPTTDSTIIAKAYPDEEFTLLARDESGEWLQIAHPDVEGGFGWVSAEYMALSGSIEIVPVSSEVSNAPAFESAPAATDVSATIEPNGASVPVSTDAHSDSVSASGLSGTLAFQSSHGMIYAYDLATGAEWPLTAGFDPAISPDGTMVAFTRDGGESGLYVINIDGSGERLIYGEKEQLSAPKWSIDGSQILFTYRTDVLESSGRGRRGGGTQTLEDLYNLAIIDINGENFADIPALDTARAADWTEAGIVYQSSAGIQIIEDVADAESQVVAFDNLNPFDYDPDWQPNGGQIAFMKQGASHWEIYAVNPDGSGMTALTKPVTALVDELPSNVAPAYSPDGQYIVYLSNRGADNSVGAWQIWVMETDGSNAHPLPIDVAIDYTFGSEQAVSWGV